jgi:short-subunit dehydrogenase
MKDLMQYLLQAWRRRRWRPDPAALAAFASLRPMTVVTGGSEGIGYALARRFAAAGHDLVLIARHVDPLAEAARRIGADFKVKAVALAVDVTSPGAIHAIDTALAEHAAYADVLINDAGMGFAGRFDEQTPEGVLQLIDLNVRALTALTRHFLTGMRVRGRGGILNLASLGAYAPGPYQAAYYASKAYVLSLSEALAAETAGEGVRIMALAPGPVNTRFHERMRAKNAFYRLLVPPASADGVARAGYLGFALGLRVVVPGVVNPFLALAMRIMPHRIVIPIIGWLLQPRGREPSDAGR